MNNNFGELSIELEGRGFAGAKHFKGSVSNTPSLLSIKLGSGMNAFASPKQISI